MPIVVEVTACRAVILQCRQFHNNGCPLFDSSIAAMSVQICRSKPWIGGIDLGVRVFQPARQHDGESIERRLWRKFRRATSPRKLPTGIAFLGSFAGSFSVGLPAFSIT